MSKERKDRERLERLLSRTYSRDLLLSRAKLQKQLSTVKKQKPKLVKSTKDLFCTICLEHIKKKDNIALLSCGHAIHLDCYDQMIVSGIPLLCPECRKPFSPERKASKTRRSRKSLKRRKS